MTWTNDPWTRYDGTSGDRRGIVIRNVAGIVAFIPQDAGREFAEFDAERKKCAALMFAAPELLALARQYASECAECDGEGTFDAEMGFEEVCEACADIRKIIAKAVGK